MALSSESIFLTEIAEILVKRVDQIAIALVDDFSFHFERRCELAAFNAEVPCEQRKILDGLKACKLCVRLGNGATEKILHFGVFDHFLHQMHALLGLQILLVGPAPEVIFGHSEKCDAIFTLIAVNVSVGNEG